MSHQLDKKLKSWEEGKYLGKEALFEKECDLLNTSLFSRDMHTRRFVLLIPLNFYAYSYIHARIE